MKKLTNILVLFSLIFFIRSGYSQDISSKVQALENDLKEFNYQRVLNLGRFLLMETGVSKKDSLKIYEYTLNAAYSLDDTLTARNLILDALTCSRNFTPNPRITSPKIINFFNSVKEKLPAVKPAVSDSSATKQSIVRVKPVPAKYLLSSLLYPGSSHLFKGHKKGYYLTGISSILLGGIIYSSFKVDDARNNYMKARTPDNFDQLYEDYNTTYKIRSGLVITYLFFNIYTLYDFYSNEIKNKEISVGVIQDPNSVSILFSYSW